MSYTVAMLLLDQLEDTDMGFPSEALPGKFPTLDAANRAGMVELERRAKPVGTLSFVVYDDAGLKIDEFGMGHP